MELKVYRITELLFIWVIHKIYWVDIFIEPCIIFNMVWFSKITHIQLIASKKSANGTSDTKLKFLIFRLSIFLTFSSRLVAKKIGEISINVCLSIHLWLISIPTSQSRMGRWTLWHRVRTRYIDEYL